MCVPLSSVKFNENALLSTKINKSITSKLIFWVGTLVQLVEYLPRMNEFLGSMASTS